MRIMGSNPINPLGFVNNYEKQTIIQNPQQRRKNAPIGLRRI